MKNTVFTVITAVLLLATLCLMAVGARVRAKVPGELPVEDVVIHIPDAELAAVIRETLGIDEGAQITELAMSLLFVLLPPSDSDRKIVDITGLEHAVNLRELSLGRVSGNPIEDISALANLTNLEGLSLDGTDVSDISVLANLTNLEWLYLGGTDVSDISVLANLTNLERLSLWSTDVSDISVLANLTNLEWLYLDGTDVSDISVLANLTNLEGLWLSDTDVSDISALAGLTDLRGLYLDGTDVSDISALAKLTNLLELYLNGTDVSDISVLAKLRNLQTLDLYDFPLSPASRTHVLALQKKGVNVRTDVNLPPVWKLHERFHPHENSYSGQIRDIGFRGNSQVFFGKVRRIYKWDMSAGRYWWTTYGSESERDRVNHVEVSESHDIFAYNYGDTLYLRRTSDMSVIASVDLPGVYPVAMTMEPRTNYILVSGITDVSTRFYMHAYDLWENNSWGLNPRPHRKYGNSRFLDIDILNRDEAYGIYIPGSAINVITLPGGKGTGRGSLPFNRAALNFNESPIAVAARQTSSGITRERIAVITNDYRLVVWDRSGTQLYSHKFDRYPVPPRSFQFTPNGEILTWIRGILGDEIVFWDVGAQKVDAVVEPKGLATCHAFSQDGKTMAVGTETGSIEIYKWTGGSALSAPAKETERSQPTALLSNYPNPFNPETWIPYQLSEAAEVTVTIHSLDGKLVRTLELGQVPAGVYSDRGRAAYWDGRNAQGEPVASGVYFYTLSAGDFKATRKMVIRK